MERGIDLVINRVAAGSVNPLLDRDLTKHQLFEFIRLRRRHAVVDRLELCLERLDRGECFGRRAAQGFVLRKFWILLEVPDAHRARDLHLAVVRLQQPRDQFEERALSAAVATDETNALALVDGAADAIKE